MKKIKEFIHKYILRHKYYRTGKCLRCGDCCKKIYVRHLKGVVKEKEEFEKLQKLHPFYQGLEIIDKDETGLVFKCNHFDEENHICKIHKKRFGICRRYPDEIILSMGAVMSEKCGYKFTPIDKFSDVLNREFKKIKKKNRNYTIQEMNE